MPTEKHRVAAYLPAEIDEKFQIFKQERGVGDSPALILILTEFFGVSREVSHSNSLDVDALKDELLNELLGELDIRFSELKGELLSKPLKSMGIIEQGLEAVKVSHDSLVDLKVTHQGLKAVELEAGFVDRPTISQLSSRFGCDSSLVRKQKSKHKDEPEKFIAWSKSRDPEGYGWWFNDEDKVFDRS
jgi:hypothetical protein